MSRVILAVNDLHKTFHDRGADGAAGVVALAGLSFTVLRGECFGLLGESGSGKTTAAKVILGLERPDRGEVKLHEADMLPGKPTGLECRRRIQMVFQDPYESLNPGMRVAEIVAEPLRIHEHRLTDGERRSRVNAAIEAVELRPAAEFAARYPHQLSGGQRQRVAIARALILQPEFIVADEPTSMLDVSVRAGVLAVLQRLQKEGNLSSLFITHDWTIARVMCDRVAVMYAGRIVEMGRTEELIREGRHPYTRALVQVVADLKGFWLQPEKYIRESTELSQAGCCFLSRCPMAVEVCERAEPCLRETAPGHWTRCHLA